MEVQNVEAVPPQVITDTIFSIYVWEKGNSVHSSWHKGSGSKKTDSIISILEGQGKKTKKEIYDYISY